MKNGAFVKGHGWLFQGLFIIHKDYGDLSALQSPETVLHLFCAAAVDPSSQHLNKLCLPVSPDFVWNFPEAKVVPHFLSFFRPEFQWYHFEKAKVSCKKSILYCCNGFGLWLFVNRFIFSCWLNFCCCKVSIVSLFLNYWYLIWY